MKAIQVRYKEDGYKGEVIKDPVYVTDTPIKSKQGLIIALYETEQAIEEVIDLVYNYRSKTKNKYLKKIINQIIDNYADLTREYLSISNRDLESFILGMEVFKNENEKQ